MGNSWLLEVAIPGYDTLPWTLFKIGLDLQAMVDLLCQVPFLYKLIHLEVT